MLLRVMMIDNLWPMIGWLVDGNDTDDNENLEVPTIYKAYIRPM